MRIDPSAGRPGGIGLKPRGEAGSGAVTGPRSALNRRRPDAVAAVLGTLALLLGSSEILGAQVREGRAIKGFQVAEQSPVNKRKSVLTGKDAVPVTKERFRISGLRVEVSEEGRLAMLVEAPECLYDYGLRSAWSSGPIRVTTGDGRITLEGEGFEWTETNTFLTITNKVRAFIRRDLIRADREGQPEASEKTPAEPVPGAETLEVRSQRFEYDADLRQVRFVGQAQVTDRALDLACERLLVSLPDPNGAIEQVVAEEDVVLIGKAEGLRATADRAVYVRGKDEVELSGRARWTMGDRSGTGETIRWQNSTRRLAVRENASVVMPIKHEELGFLSARPPGEPAPAPALPTARAIEIRSDSFDLAGREAKFEGHVQARNLEAGQERGRLSCRDLEITVGTSNRLERIAAQGDVAIQESGRQVKAERAVMNADGILELTGEPSWSFEQMAGRADRLVLDRQKDTVLAAPRVQVTFPATSIGASYLLLRKKPGLPEPGVDLPRSIRISADRLDSVGNRAEFSGHVKTEDLLGSEPTAEITSGVLVIVLDSARTAPTYIEARENVVVAEVRADGGAERPAGRLTCDQVSARLEGAESALSTAKAQGDVRWTDGENSIETEEAVFSGTDDSIRLFGHPALQTKEAKLMGADTIRWDPRRKNYRATGKWRLEWLPEAGADSTRPL